MSEPDREGRRVLPMFPLGSVLFPGMGLPLHVFEPRYRVLVHDCLLGEREFGVVLIERGFEVGGGDQRFPVGTIARIVRASELDDGRWVVVAVGTKRLRVERWLDDDPYPRAEVVELPSLSLHAGAEEGLGDVERSVRRALQLLGRLEAQGRPGGALADVGPGTTDPDGGDAAQLELSPDPGERLYQLAAVAPLGPVDRQLLLEQDDPQALVRRLVELTDDASELLAYRLKDG